MTLIINSSKRRDLISFGPANYFSDTFKDLFSRLVAFEPSERLKIEEIASHPWVREPICTHSEIKEEFTARQKKLDIVLE